LERWFSLVEVLNHRYGTSPHWEHRLNRLEPPPPAEQAAPAAGWTSRFAANTSWAFRRIVPLSSWGDRVAQHLAPPEGEPAGVLGRMARAWMEAAGPQRQAELRLDDRLQAIPSPDDPGLAIARQHDDLAALERLLNRNLGPLPPDDPLPPYSPTEINLEELLEQHRGTVQTFCERAALHAALAGAAVLSGSGVGEADVFVCLRSAIAGLPRWNSWQERGQSGLVPASGAGLAQRAERLFLQMLHEKGVGWAGRLQARTLLKGLHAISDHVLPRLGMRLLQDLHHLGEDAQMGQLISIVRLLVEVVAHHLQQVNRIERWASAQRPFFDERTGLEEGPAEDRQQLLDRELRKATYHHEVNWEDACRWCHRWIIDRWGAELFGFSESAAAWMRPSPPAAAGVAPRGADRIWQALRKGLFYLRLPLVALCVFFLRLVESWILNPLSRAVILRVLHSRQAMGQAIDATIEQLRPSPVARRAEDGAVTLRGFSYPLDVGLRTLYRMVRQLLIFQREQPDPPVQQWQRLRDGSRLRIELDEGLQHAVGQMTRSLCELISRLRGQVAAPRRWLLSLAGGQPQTALFAVDGVGRVLTLLTHDPVLRQQPAEGLCSGLSEVYSLDPDPTLAEQREMHNLQRLSRRWMLRELRATAQHETRRAIRGEAQRGFEQELADFHRALLSSLPEMPAARNERALWFQEIQRLLPRWDQQIRQLAVREQIEACWPNGQGAGQVYLEIERSLRRMQLVMRVIQAGEEGQLALQSLERRARPSIDQLQGWRSGIFDRCEQLRILVGRLLRQTAAPLREDLETARVYLERLSEGLRQMELRLERFGGHLQRQSQEHDRWSHWRRQWQGCLRVVREAQQRAEGAVGAARREAQRQLRHLEREQHQRMVALVPPSDPQGAWAELSGRPAARFFQGPEAEDLLEAAILRESHLAAQLDGLDEECRREGLLARGLEQGMMAVVRAVVQEGALAQLPDPHEGWQQPGDLALLLALHRSNEDALSFADLVAHLDEHDFESPDEAQEGVAREAILERRLQLIERNSQFWHRFSEGQEDLPLYRPDWQAPETWRSAALALRQTHRDLYTRALLGRGQEALQSWRGLLPQAGGIQQEVDRQRRVVVLELSQARAPATLLGLRLLQEGLSSEPISAGRESQRHTLQDCIGQLVHRLKQLEPLCVAQQPTRPERWLAQGLAFGAADLGCAVAGIESVGDALIDTMLSPSHVRGLMQEMVTRIGLAYAQAQGSSIEGPRHRALRDGAGRQA
jgi:hypothetical protein